MTPPHHAATVAANEMALNRRLRELRESAASFKRSKMSPLQLCEAIIDGRLVDSRARSFVSGLPADERHYWIASLYALRMSKRQRRRADVTSARRKNSRGMTCWNTSLLSVHAVVAR